jgi:hypothetical protein
MKYSKFAHNVLSSVLVLGAMVCTFSFATAAEGEHEKWKKEYEEFERTHGNWNDFRTQFYKAYDAGDIETLEHLKSEWTGVGGFANINDLGGKFMKYGSGMDKWNQLIEDAERNKK